MDGLSTQEQFANNVRSWHGMIAKSSNERQVESAVNKFYDAAKAILTSDHMPFGFDVAHPITQYRFIDEAIEVMGNYFGDDSAEHAELKELLRVAEPIEMDQYGGFSVVKHVHGLLSDRGLIEFTGGGIEGKVLVPTKGDFPLAEQFRADNFGDNAALYLCQDTQREFARLRAHYRDVVLVRSPTE